MNNNKTLKALFITAVLTVIVVLISSISAQPRTFADQSEQKIRSIIAEKGPSSIEGTMEGCYKQDHATARVCARGSGEGLLLWFGRENFATAAAACENEVARSARFPRFECIQGIFKEHTLSATRAPGTPQDTYYPCDVKGMPELWQRACYGQLPLAFYKNVRNDKTRGVALCAEAPSANQAACFDGLAKMLTPLMYGDFTEAKRSCTEIGAATNAAREEECLISMAVETYAQGDSDFSYRLCEAVGSVNGRVLCGTYIQRAMLSSF